MKVRELIESLRNVDPELDVCEELAAHPDPLDLIGLHLAHYEGRSYIVFEYD